MERDPRVWVAESRNFALGVITSQDACDIEPQACLRTENGIIATDGAYERRPGFKAIEGLSFDAAVQAVEWLSTPDEEGLIVVAGGDVLFVADGDPDSPRTRYLMRYGIAPDGASYGGPAIPESGPVLVARRFGEALLADASIMSYASLLLAAGAHPSGSIGAVCSNIGGPFTGTSSELDGVFVVRFAASGDGFSQNAATLSVAPQPSPSQPLSVTYDEAAQALSVRLATDASGQPVSTVQQVVNAINALSPAYFVATAWGTPTAVCKTFSGTRTFWGGASSSYIEGAYPTTACRVAGRLPDWPTAMAVEPTTGRVFIVNATDPSSVAFSDVRDPSTWPSENVLYGEDAFTGLAAVSGTMLLFQERTILRIDGTDPTTWTVTQVPAHGAGLPPRSWRGLIELEGVAAYASHTGIMAFNGARPTPLSIQVVGTDPDSRLVPTGDVASPIMLRYREWLLIMWQSGESETQAMLYAFREDRWCGPWTLPFAVTAACWDAREGGVDAPLYLGTADGLVLADDWDDRTDGGQEQPFEDALHTKRYDGGREAVDKHVIELRVLYDAEADTTCTVELWREGEAAPALSAEMQAEQGKGVLVKRVPHLRCRDWGVVVRHADGTPLRVTGVEATYFFARTR